MPTDLLSRETSALLIVDVQERLMPVIHDGAAVLERIGFLADVARLLGVPVLVSEQYPQGLGPTVETLRARVPAWDPVVKVEFSCAPNPVFAARWAALRRPQLVVAGIEAHVCVAQTALELAASGTRVFLAADATGSRRPLDAAVALDRMRAGGITVTTAEAVAFEWLRRAGTGDFKAVSALVKGTAERPAVPA